MAVMIRKADNYDLVILAGLACQLWPEHTATQMQEEMALMLEDGEAALFLAFDEAKAIGFAQCQLRHDYVEGTESSPVGYLEGIYVTEAHRHQGIARELLAACEAWVKAQGCTEFASDCELDNIQSLRFHLGVGFTEANRVICFTKRLN